ncbi:MAG: alpha/beta hydrolase [Lentisphaeraceae bacterium]|nr:alpha/beta hydrolase [Lentisphaeraceae bacterium]
MNTDVNIQIGNFEELQTPIRSKSAKLAYSVTMRVLKCFLLTCGMIYVLICLMFLLFQNRLIFMPTHFVSQVPVRSAHSFANLLIPSQSGQNINAWFVPSKSNTGTVMYCRGNKGNMSDDIRVIQVWNKLGYNVMIFDYQGFGISKGEPSEYNCYDDADAVYSWLRNNRLINKKFIIHGKSIGGAVAAKLATSTKCDGLIIESSFTSIEDLGKKRFPYIPGAFYYNEFPTETLLKSVSSPVLVMHSSEDETVPFGMGQKLFDAVKGEKSFFTLKGEHNETMAQTPSYLRALETFSGSLKRN